MNNITLPYTSKKVYFRTVLWILFPCHVQVSDTALSQFSPADLEKLSSSVVQEFLSQLLVKVYKATLKLSFSMCIYRLCGRHNSDNLWLYTSLYKSKDVRGACTRATIYTGRAIIIFLLFFSEYTNSRY